MPSNGRKFVRIVKFLLAGVTVFCISWIASVSEWHTSLRWTNRQGLDRSMSTMRTIVAYSEQKQAEMDRPTPVTCDRLPVFPKLFHNNRNWSRNTGPKEWQRVVGTRVSLYAAYYDERTPQHYVRILAMFSGRNYSSEDTLFCQTRSVNAYNDAVEVVAAKPLEIWWHMWDEFSSSVNTPLLLSCPLIEPLHGPSVVSVVTQPCDDPTNAFKLKPDHVQEYERMFTICVKDMNFNKDISQNLVEWIEINKILGVDMIDVYIDDVTRDTEEVLLHYQSKGYVRLFHVPIKYKSNRSLWQRRRDHIITYNDCLYRNLKESKFIVPLDVDEIILPKIADTWLELYIRFKEQGWDTSKHSSIIIQNVFFFDFMQDLNKYVNNRTQGVKNKIYIKRDDVRIKKLENLDIGEIELVEYPNLKNALIDININKKLDQALYKKYKSRCGVEMSEPKLSRHIVSSTIISPVGDYSKSWMLTKKVLTAFNHYPLTSIGTPEFTGWSPPFIEVQLNHYKESCNTTVFEDCGRYGKRARIDTAALRLSRRLKSALANTICIPIKNH